MTGASIVVNRADIEAAVGRLGGLVDLNVGDLLDEIGGALVTSTGDRFETGVGPDGVEWTPSARALADNGQTLVDHGHLRDSITHAKKGDSAVAVGTNVVYAAAHQFGADIQRYAQSRSIYRVGRHFAKLGAEGGRTTWHEVGEHTITLPARPFLGVSDADTAEIREIVSDHLRGGLGA